MSEAIDNSKGRKARLKELILKLHAGEDQKEVRQELLATLGSIPYGEVVAVEQELISEGLPEAEVLKLCDAHSAVLDGRVDTSGQQGIPPGHPVDVFQKENAELRKVTEKLRALLTATAPAEPKAFQKLLLDLRSGFNQLADLDKHYRRKEYLLFPFLEKAGITGPPKVMWGKHDELREQLRGAFEVLAVDPFPREELAGASELVFLPLLKGIDDMTKKEEELLFPMALDTLPLPAWHEISQQSIEFGFCLYDPPSAWPPADEVAKVPEAGGLPAGGRIQLPTGSFSLDELTALFSTLPVDVTFVDKDDKVKFYSHGPARVFQRNRAILNRDVRHCHPPASAHIVEKILTDFRSGRASRAPFWIRMGEKYVHIEYFALRDPQGAYLGTLEVSHDIAPYRALEGEQRILNYAGQGATHG